MELFERGLKCELHCHNKYSNYRLKYSMFGLDCGTSVEDQVKYAKTSGLDVLFVTNHNTLDGYRQAAEYQADHPSLGGLKIFQGAEYSVDVGNGKYPHVGALGLVDPIKPYQTLDETIEDVRRQGAISVAEHPFDVTGSGIMDQSHKCDVIEGFNSNNYDIFSNLRAQLFALNHDMYSVSGSDSHLPRTIGKSTITVYPRDMHIDDVSAYDVTEAILLGNFVVNPVSYNTMDDFKEMVLYHFSNRAEIMDDLKRRFPWFAVALGEKIYEAFEKNPNSPFLDALGSIFLKRMRNLSEKVNIYKYKDRLIHDSSIWRKIVESALPTLASRSGSREHFAWAQEYLRNYNFKNPEMCINAQNDSVRGRRLEVAGEIILEASPPQNTEEPQSVFHL